MAAFNSNCMEERKHSKAMFSLHACLAPNLVLIIYYNKERNFDVTSNLCEFNSDVLSADVGSYSNAQH